MLTAIRERPIIFSGPMIRALLDGRKTMTRRLFKLPRGMRWYGGPGELGGEATGDFCDDPGAGWYHVSEWSCPFGQVGDRLWVRETWYPSLSGEGVDWVADGVLYRAENEGLSPHVGCSLGKRLNPVVRLSAPQGAAWRSPRFMPRWASRLALEITGVKVERLDAISEEDAVAEGIANGEYDPGVADGGKPGWRYAPGRYAGSPRHAFELLWESIHGKDSWALNPWVWALSFRVLPPSESRP